MIRTKPLAEIALGEGASTVAWRPDGGQADVGGAKGGVMAFEVNSRS